MHLNKINHRLIISITAEVNIKISSEIKNLTGHVTELQTDIKIIN